MRVRIQAFFSYLEMMNFDAKVDAGAGGILASNAFPGIETESVWIATFTSFIIWLLALVITPLAATADSNGKLHIPKAIRNFARTARDSFLIMLGMTTINQAGYGVSSGVVALTWIVFGLLVVWMFMHVLGSWIPYPFWIDILIFLPVMVLAIINFGLAFRGAPSYK